MPLGCRLWRRPDVGANFEIPEKDLEKVHSVGIAFLPDCTINQKSVAGQI